MKNSFVSTLYIGLLFSIFVSGKLFAAFIVPSDISEEEGTATLVSLTIEPADWTIPDSGDPCEGLGDQFLWSAILEDGSAAWGDDLTITINGVVRPPGNPISGPAVCSTTGNLQTITVGTLNLLPDNEEQGDRAASLIIEYRTYDCSFPASLEGTNGLPPYCNKQDVQNIQIQDRSVPVAGIRKISDAAEPETDGHFEVFLDQPAPPNFRVTMDYSGDAKRGDDYNVGFVEFTEGARVFDLVVQVEPDDDVEDPPETVTASIRPSENYDIDQSAASASLKIQDDDQRTISIATSQNASENPATSMKGTFTVTLSPEAPDGGATFSYEVVTEGQNNPATEGTDYKTLSRSVTVPAGALSQDIPVNVEPDSEQEGTETVTVMLTDYTGYTLQGDASATMQITDDDMAALVINPTQGLTVDESGSTDTFTVKLASMPSSNVQVILQSSNENLGTIESPANAELSFTSSNWDTAQTVTIKGQDDGQPGGAQQFEIVMNSQSSDPNYSALPPSSVSVTNTGGIPGTVQFSMSTYTVNESEGPAEIRIERVNGSSGPLTAEFSTADSGSDNSATADEDYASTMVTLEWEDGKSDVKTVEIEIYENDDATDEGGDDGKTQEDVKLLLKSAGTEQSATLIIEEEPTPPPPPPPPPDTPVNQVIIAETVLETCPNGDNVGGFQQACNGLVTAWREGEDVSEALKEITPDDAASVRISGMQTTTVQVSAVGSRLGAIRGGGGAGFSVSGLSMNYGDVAITGDLIKSFVSSFDNNNPAFMQLNANQNDDSGYLEEFGRWGAWISGRVIFGEKDPTTNQVGYDFDTAGLTFGLDYRFTDEFVAGIAAGYADTDADLGVNDGELDTTGWSASVYGTWFKSDRFYLGGSLGWGNNEYEQLRNVKYDLGLVSTPDIIYQVDETNGAEYDGTQFSALLDGGWDFHRNGWTYGPTLKVSYMKVKVDGYDETLVRSSINNPLYNLGWGVHIDDQSYESLQPSIGFSFSKAVSRSWGVFIPQGYLDVVSELEDGSWWVTGNYLGDVLPDNDFRMKTDDFKETFARAGLGFGFILKNNKSAFLMFDGEFGRDLLKTYYINAGFRWQF